MENEIIWKPIPGFSRYEASNSGLLRSMNYKRTGKVKILKPAISDGYLKTMLQDDNGKYKSLNVHTFVCLTWHWKHADDLEVNHLDGVKLNNHESNLEWCTRAQNVQHAFDNGLMIPKRGSLNGMAKLNEDQVREIREFAKIGGNGERPGNRYYGRKELALKYGVSECTIKEVVSRRRNKFQDA
jgi:hypothetical protein